MCNLFYQAPPGGTQSRNNADLFFDFTQSRIERKIGLFTQYRTNLIEIGLFHEITQEKKFFSRIHAINLCLLRIMHGSHFTHSRRFFFRFHAFTQIFCSFHADMWSSSIHTLYPGLSGLLKIKFQVHFTGEKTGSRLVTDLPILNLTLRRLNQIIVNIY